jgi:hypothetical protein
MPILGEFVDDDQNEPDFANHSTKSIPMTLYSYVGIGNGAC